MIHVPLIALTGKRLSGKSTLADHIVSKYGYTKKSFASPMKKMLIAMGVPPENIFGNKKEEVIPHLGVSGRYLMQTLGTQWGRNLVSKDIWWRSLIHSADFQHHYLTDGVVVDDCRFDSESSSIRSLGGVIVRVVREGLVTSGDDVDQHESEQPLSKVDYEIVSKDGDITDIFQKFDHFMIDLKLSHV